MCVLAFELCGLLAHPSAQALQHFAIKTDSAFWASSYTDATRSGVDEGWDERGASCCRLTSQTAC